MAILGYNTQGPSTMGWSVGRCYVSKFTLAAAGTLTELHGKMGVTAAAGCQTRLVIYAADGAGGNPGTRLGYTNILTWSGVAEVSQTGLSIALAAGDYWLGFSGITFTGGAADMYGDDPGGTHAGLVSGAPDPPPNPFGTPTTTGSRKISVWGVVSDPPPPAPFTNIRFGTGLSVVDLGSGSIRVNASSEKVLEVKVFDDATAVTTGDGKVIICVPEAFHGMNLTAAHAFVTTVSSSGTPTVQIRNVTDSVDMLSTRITIDASEFTSYTAAVSHAVDVTKDDVVKGDLIAVDVDVAGTGAKGLGVILTFALP